MTRVVVVNKNTNSVHIAIGLQVSVFPVSTMLEC